MGGPDVEEGSTRLDKDHHDGGSQPGRTISRSFSLSMPSDLDRGRRNRMMSSRALIVEKQRQEETWDPEADNSDSQDPEGVGGTSQSERSFYSLPKRWLDFLTGNRRSLSGSEYLGDEEADGVRVRTAAFDLATEHHYVFVLHGTYNAPDGSPTWYFPAPEGETNFCSKLASLLDKTKIGGKALWRELPCEVPSSIPYPFHWDGLNEHQGRVDGAIRVRRKRDARKGIEKKEWETR